MIRPLSKIRAGGDFWHPQRKPVGPVEIAWSHPLARGLVAVYGVPLSRIARELIAGGVIEPLNGASVSPAHGFNLPGGSSAFRTAAPKLNSGKFTVFAKAISFGSLGQWAGIYKTWDNANHGPVHLGKHYTSNYISVYVSESSGTQKGPAYDNLAIPVGVPFTTCAVADGATVRVYRDGYAAGVTVSYNGTLQYDSNYAGIGAKIFNDGSVEGGRSWNGAIDLVYYYDRGLSAAEVAALDRNPYAFLRPANERIWVPVSGGGGTSYNVGVTLTQTLSKTPSVNANFNAGVTLAQNVGVSDGTVMNTTQGLTLAQTLSQAVAATANMGDGVAMSLSLSQQVSTGNILAAQLALAQALGVAHGVGADLQVASSFSISLSQQQQAALDTVVQATLALQQGMTPSAQVDALASALFGLQQGVTTAAQLISGAKEGLLTLGAAYGVSPAAIEQANPTVTLALQQGLTGTASADLLATVALGLQKALTPSSGRDLSDAVSLALQQSLSSTALITIEGSLSLGVGLAVADSVAAQFAPSLSLGTVLTAAAQTIANLHTDLQLNNTLAAVYASGGVLDTTGVSYKVVLTTESGDPSYIVKVTKPDGEILEISCKNRVISATVTRPGSVTVN